MNLTTRQREVAELIADGYTDKQIMALLELSAAAVRCHVDALVAKMRLNRTRNLRVQIAGFIHETRARSA